MKKTAEYICWENMRRRCFSFAHPSYYNYGGRGIGICERWNNYSNFLADMGKRPSVDHSIERRDNNGDYFPENCYWATPQEQGINKRVRKDNKSGIPGVKEDPRNYNWIAFGATKGRTRKQLYYGPDFFEACCARKSWEVKGRLGLE